MQWSQMKSLYMYLAIILLLNFSGTLSTIKWIHLCITVTQEIVVHLPSHHPLSQLYVILCRLVKEILQELRKDFRIWATTIGVLHEVNEAFLIKVLEDVHHPCQMSHLEARGHPTGSQDLWWDNVIVSSHYIWSTWSRKIHSRVPQSVSRLVNPSDLWNCYHD